MGVDVTALASFLLFCFSPLACLCCQNETCLVQATAPILPSRQTQVWKSVMASAALCLLPSLLFISQLLIMGCFSRMKTPGKEFGWKQAEHWITTCCEMGYVVDVVFVPVFVLLLCLWAFSRSQHTLSPQRRETQLSVLLQGELIPSFVVVDFVRAAQVVIGNTGAPNS